MKKRIFALFLTVLLAFGAIAAIYAEAAPQEVVTLADENRNIIGNYAGLDTAFKAAMVNKMKKFILRLNEDVDIDGKAISLMSIDPIEYTIEGAGHRITQHAEGKNTLVISGNSNTKVTIKDIELFGTKSALVVKAGKIKILSGYFYANSYSFDTTVDIYPDKDHSAICDIMGGTFESKTNDLSGSDTRMSALRITNTDNCSTANGPIDNVALCNIYGGYFRSELSNFSVMNADCAVTNVYGGVFFNSKLNGYTFFNNSKDPITKANIYGGTFVLESGATGSVVRNNKDGGVMYLYGGNYIGGTGMFRNVGSSGTPDRSAWGAGNPACASIAVPVMSAGAGVRLVENSAGLAFYTSIDKETIDTIKACADNNTSIKLGAIVVDSADLTGIPAVTEDVLNNKSIKYQDITATGTYDFNSDVSYAVAIKNISAANASKKLVAVPYITVTVNDIETRFYGMYDISNARSISDVATAALADSNTEYTAQQQAILNSYVGK